MLPKTITMAEIEASRAPKKQAQQTNGHGGKRPGAGRKAPDGPRVNFTTKIAVVTRERINALKEKGITIGSHVDLLVEDLCAENGIELS